MPQSVCQRAGSTCQSRALRRTAEVPPEGGLESGYRRHQIPRRLRLPHRHRRPSYPPHRHSFCHLPMEGPRSRQSRQNHDPPRSRVRPALPPPRPPLQNARHSLLWFFPPRRQSHPSEDCLPLRPASGHRPNSVGSASRTPRRSTLPVLPPTNDACRLLQTPPLVCSVARTPPTHKKSTHMSASLPFHPRLRVFAFRVSKPDRENALSCPDHVPVGQNALQNALLVKAATLRSRKYLRKNTAAQFGPSKTLPRSRLNSGSCPTQNA